MIISSFLKGDFLLLWISTVSFVFYALFGQAWFLIPMAVTIVIDYFVALGLDASSQQGVRRLLLIFSLCGNLGLLIFFKYSGLFWSLGRETMEFYSRRSWHGSSFLERVILPAGISFYTFQTLSYIIDVYRRETPAERNFFKFTAFVSFFPHLIAGPLTRHHQLLPGLEKIKQEGIQPRWSEGIFLFCIGLSKKILLADRIAGCIDPLLQNSSSFGMVAGWLSLIGYALQIYFDFSGYCDMALGLGRLFGIELPQNFNDPYRAINPSDFWRRWHITLGTWMRDYIYLSLGGSRGAVAMTAFNLFVTMLLGGLWHGARWTYLIWGAYHGTLLMLYHVYKNAWDRRPAWMQRGLTFMLVILGWVFFRSETFLDSLLWFRGLFGFNGLQLFQLNGLNPWMTSFLWMTGMVVIGGWPVASSTSKLGSLRRPWQVALAGCTVASLLLMNHSSRFLYFQF